MSCRAGLDEPSKHLWAMASIMESGLCLFYNFLASAAFVWGQAKWTNGGFGL